MGLFDFVRNAGAKIFGDKKPDNDNVDSVKPLRVHLQEHGIDPTNIRFRFERDGLVIVEGSVPDQDTREKAVLIVGNVDGIERVDDRLVVGAPKPAAATTVATSAPAASNATASTPAPVGGSQSVAHHTAGSASGWTSKTYTVQKGDTLSQIAKRELGDAGRYPEIFEANKPMLKDPDKIYPGQVLRIPAGGSKN